MLPLYNYKVALIRVIDGDSAWLELDLGLRTYMKANCRLSRANAPERNSRDAAERAAAADSADFLESLLMTADELRVQSIQLDKYGRPLVELWARYLQDWQNVNDLMIETGYAETYE